MNFVALATFATLVGIALNTSHARKLPSYITKCAKNDPKLMECILREVEVIRPHMKAGIPEMHIPPMEPIVVEEARLQSGQSFNVSFYKIKMYGLTGFEVKEAHVDLEKAVIDLKLNFPHNRLLADYEIKGKIMIMTIDGKGKFEGLFNNSFVEAHIKGTPEVRKGKNYINYHSVELKIVWGQAHMQFDDIFKGNSELTKQTNQIINDNAAMVLEEIRPAAEQTISAIVLSLIKGIADRFSLQDLFVY